MAPPSQNIEYLPFTLRPSFLQFYTYKIRNDRSHSEKYILYFALKTTKTGNFGAKLMFSAMPENTNLAKTRQNTRDECSLTT